MFRNPDRIDWLHISRNAGFSWSRTVASHAPECWLLLDRNLQGQVFPNAPCVISLIDRLIHHAEILAIEGDSYRLKEARERAERRLAAQTSKTSLTGTA